MALIVSTKPIRYKGRFYETAVNLVKSGVRVGMIWTLGEEKVHCHVCDKDFKTPTLDPVHKDCLSNCEHCDTPFVISYYSG